MSLHVLAIAIYQLHRPVVEQMYAPEEPIRMEPVLYCAECTRYTAVGQDGIRYPCATVRAADQQLGGVRPAPPDGERRREDLAAALGIATDADTARARSILARNR